MLFNYSGLPFLPIPPPPTPAKPTSLPHLHSPPWFCPCVLYSSSCNPLSPLGRMLIFNLTIPSHFILLSVFINLNAFWFCLHRHKKKPLILCLKFWFKKVVSSIPSRNDHCCRKQQNSPPLQCLPDRDLTGFMNIKGYRELKKSLIMPFTSFIFPCQTCNV